MGPRKKTAAKKGKSKVPAEPEQEAQIEEEQRDSSLAGPIESPTASMEEVTREVSAEAEVSPTEHAEIETAGTLPLDSADTSTSTPQAAKSAPATFSTAEMNSRLFQLRMKINQGRKANEAEAEEEFKRLNKGRRRGPKGADEEEEEEEDGKDRSKQSADPVAALLHQTAQEAEWEAVKTRRKEEIAATYGLNAFTTDASYRAYEKRVQKLQRQQPSSSGAPSLVENPLDYGKVGARVSAAGLERLQQDVLDREERRKQFSKRRLTTDADVDYINDKNAAFNKKLKNAYNKYTIEIRQNLERGTAV